MYIPKCSILKARTKMQYKHQKPQIRSDPREEYHHLDPSLLTPSRRWSLQKKTFIRKTSQTRRVS